VPQSRILLCRLAARLGVSVNVLIAGVTTITLGAGATSAVVIASAGRLEPATTSAGSLSVSATGSAPAANASVSSTASATPSATTPRTGVGSQPPQTSPSPNAPATSRPAGVLTSPTPRAAAASPSAAEAATKGAVTEETVPSDPIAATQLLLSTKPPAGSMATPDILEAQPYGRISTTEPANQFTVIAMAGVMTDATATWIVDFGDGTAAASDAVPPEGCGPAAPGTWLVMDDGLVNAPHFYAAPGTYTITVSMELTGCDGSPGPAATTSFRYQYISDGGTPYGGYYNWTPDPAYLVPPGFPQQTGTVSMPPSADDPGGIDTPMYSYCSTPASVAPGAQFTIACTVVTADDSTPITFTCDYVGCTIPGTPVRATPGTAFGAPADIAVVNIPEIMPTGHAEVNWNFAIQQGATTVQISHGVTAAG